MSYYVEEKDLRNLKKAIIEESDLLIQYCKKFNSVAREIDSLLEKMRDYYNTSSGNLKYNKIVKTNFSSEELSSFSKGNGNIKIDYYLTD